MSYVPNATDVSQPTTSQTVESAALEFRTLKASIPVQIGAAATAAAVALAEETAAREAADAALEGVLTTIDLSSAGIGITSAFAFQHPNNISATQASLPGTNALSAGPLVIASGVSITIPSNSNWVIV